MILFIYYKDILQLVIIYLKQKATSTNFQEITTSNIINQHATLTFSNISALTQSQIKEIMHYMENTKFDMSGCLRSCSNHGKCPLDSSQNAFVCKCDTNFIGNACQKDIRPCSQEPCLNNGECITLNSTLDATNTYTCICPNNYNGLFCELKVDICQNTTCSSNGFCFDLNGEPKCKCFLDYDGENCENVGQIQKIRRSIQVSSIIILVGSIGTLIMLVILDDILSLLGIKRKNRIHSRRFYSKSKKKNII